MGVSWNSLTPKSLNCYRSLRVRAIANWPVYRAAVRTHGAKSGTASYWRAEMRWFVTHMRTERRWATERKGGLRWSV